MKSRNNRHVQRVKKMVVTCAMIALILGVSTYAWFIGMKTVNVSTFDVSIAAIDSLSLSLDGNKWSDTVTINGTNYNDTNVVYTGNTNSWGGTGLVPMSSVGKIDSGSSRLILFEKGSLTVTPGGYRLMASQVNNTASGVTEQNGYVAFDLFVKNLSGNAYYDTLDVRNEEAVYLTIDSEVKVAEGGQAGTGIENSVRVAFAQIGRVSAKAATSTQAVITGIACENGEGSTVTSICSRDAQIWEPNDRLHVQNAINWYTTSCRKRTGATTTSEASYTGNYGGCGTVGNGGTYPTYAVSGEITLGDSVDVYDGPAYNGYTGTIASTATTGKLMAYPTFTDSMKLQEGTARPTFMTLAPNSITKVRVYVYIEGQDIDNYDFASLGKKISVAFGFTKERFFGEDTNYDDTNTATLPADVVRANHITAVQ